MGSMIVESGHRVTTFVSLSNTISVIASALSTLASFFQKSARGCLLRQRPNYQSHLTKVIELGGQGGGAL